MEGIGKERGLCYLYSPIKDLYDWVITSVRTQEKVIKDFPIKINLHKGSLLSPYLFTLVLDILI